MMMINQGMGDGGEKTEKERSKDRYRNHYNKTSLPSDTISAQGMHYGAKHTHSHIYANHKTKLFYYNRRKQYTGKKKTEEGRGA